MIPEKRRYNVGVVKIPHAERDIAHDIITPQDDKRFIDVIGADTDDDDDEFPVGADCTYSVMLTPEEADRFSEASNLRYIEPETPTYPVGGDDVVLLDPEEVLTGPAAITPRGIPTDRTMAYMRANFPRITELHGTDVTVAVLDQGTTAAVRAWMGYTLVGRTIIGDLPPPGEEIRVEQRHGCLVAANAVPHGGRLLDAFVTREDGRSSDTLFAAGLRWAAQNGAKLVNYSFTGYQASSVYVDALNYAGQFDCVVFIAAGNDSLNQIGYPARYSQTMSSWVASCIAFDEVTDTKASFSNYHSSATGCGPGVLVNSLTPGAAVIQWSGTSAAAPHMLHLTARMQTGGRMTSRAALAAMKQYRRNTGQGADLQGGGAFSLNDALIGTGFYRMHGRGAGLMVL
jgi:hypothetical protein